MKKSIIPNLILSIAAGLALTLSFSAFAADDNPNDQQADKKAGPATAAKAPAHAAAKQVAKAPTAPVHVAQHQMVNKNADTAASHNAANPATTKHIATNKPAVTSPASPNVAQQHNTRTTTTANTTIHATNIQVAAGSNGGGKYTRANNYGGRWTAGNNHPNWNQGQVNDWNGHQYRWYDGGWLMVDGGFWPVPVYQGGGSMMAGAQQQLATDGYYNGPIDGIAGPGTRQAIANYQTANNLPVTGHLNIPTQQSLGLD